MSDQSGPDLGTPDVAGPEGSGTTAEQQQAEVDWEKRYNDLRPEYTQTSQENADLRRAQELYEILISTDDPDTRRQAAEALGYQLDEEPEAEGIENPFAHYDERLDRLEQSISQRDQDAADADYASAVRQACDERLGELGIDEDDQDWVLAYAINALPVNEEGLPDIDQAYQAFSAREVARQRKWADGKRAAPHIAPHGQAATEVPNLDNRQERVDWMVQRMQEGQATY